MISERTSVIDFVGVSKQFKVTPISGGEETPKTKKTSKTGQTSKSNSALSVGGASYASKKTSKVCKSKTVLV